MNKKDYPELAEQWDYERNAKDGITFDEITPGTHKKVWWKCKNGHEWKASVSNRVKGRRCPVCSNKRVLPGVNDLATLNPQLTSEWNYEKNGDLKPQDFTPNSNKKVWWKCSKGHEWEAVIYSRNAGRRCPVCLRKSHVSFPEKVLFFYIQRVFPDAIENYKSSWLGKRELDIYIPSRKVGIEYDGVWYHKGKDKRDVEKDRLCDEQGITLIRIREKGASYINSSAIVFILPEDHRTSGEHIIPGIHFLEKQLGVSFDVNLLRDYDDIRNIVARYDLDNCVRKTNPELLDEWDYEKNEKNGCTPDNVSAGEATIVWWKCKEGYSYRATVNNKTSNHVGCPFCNSHKVLSGFNDLATLNPQLAKEWDYEKNGDLSPRNVMPGSGKKVWWKCLHDQNQPNLQIEAIQKRLSRVFKIPCGANEETLTLAFLGDESK